LTTTSERSRGPASSLLAGKAVGSSFGGPGSGEGQGSAGGWGSGGAGWEGSPPATRQRWWRFEQMLPRGLTVAVWIPLLAIVLLVVVLVVKAVPAIRFNGLHFFTSDAWSTGNAFGSVVTTGGVRHFVGASYGVLPLVVGTLISSAIAIALAVPIGVATALVIVEKLPMRVSSGVGFCLEVLAGVPSAVYGIWGVLTFGPWLAHHIDGPIARNMPDVPVLRWFRGAGPHNVVGQGHDLLTGGLILTVMILPIIAATTRDLLRQVPRATVEGATALGLTDAEAVNTVTLRWVRSGIIGASMLGLGRALGETIMVAMVGGALLGSSPHSIFSAFNTIAAAIVTQLEAALSDPTGLQVGTLAEIALVLLVISLAANVIARWLVQRGVGTALPVGRGI
jgi:phosphate transport system permease protein